VTFDDVAGIDEVETEINEVVDYLRDPEKYRKLGARAPKGVLLTGAPGTGKTLLARATAGEAKVPFFSASGSEFIEMIVGVGASRVRELFEDARKVAPSIIFIDEIDTIGRSRSGTTVGGHDEAEQTLNQILTEMDGFTGSEGVVVLAATNRPDVLDPALLRPGRFDRTITVNAPDRKGRADILQVHTREVPLADDVDLDRLAASTPGMTGADLANLVNEAALAAARQGQNKVTSRDLFNALEKVQLGTARNVVMPDEERRRTAFHESGHALLGMLQPGADPVRKVSIIPRGHALGVTLSTPEEDRYGYSAEYLRGRIIGALGGMAAEQEVFGVVTTGAESDLENATNIARSMVGRWGCRNGSARCRCCRGRGIRTWPGYPTRCSEPSTTRFAVSSTIATPRRETYCGRTAPGSTTLLPSCSRTRRSTNQRCTRRQGFRDRPPRFRMLSISSRRVLKRNQQSPVRDRPEGSGDANHQATWRLCR
jgi:cell division protease FtsH